MPENGDIQARADGEVGEVCDFPDEDNTESEPDSPARSPSRWAAPVTPSLSRIHFHPPTLHLRHDSPSYCPSGHSQLTEEERVRYRTCSGHFFSTPGSSRSALRGFEGLMRLRTSLATVHETCRISLSIQVR